MNELKFESWILREVANRKQALLEYECKQLKWNNCFVKFQNFIFKNFVIDKLTYNGLY